MGFPNIGPGELILILIIALIVLGPGKLPDVASSLGRSVREFRKAATDVSDAGRLDAQSSTSATTTPAATGPAGPPPAAPPPPPRPADEQPPAASADTGAPASDPNAS